MKESRIRHYVVRGHKHVAGWLSRIDAEIYSTLMQEQSWRGVEGDALEIGVHHGRSFLVLNLCVRTNEMALAVDIFDKQHLNVENPSGKGDLRKFKKNLGRYGDESRASILTTSSLDLKSTDILSHPDGFRFISIDGAHWYEAILSDLRLAAACAGRDCVIAIDDFFNPDFPEVSAAYYAWMADKPEFIPLCVSRSKMYVCKAGGENHYFRAIAANKYLNFNSKKKIKYLNHDLVVITGRYSGVWGLAQQYARSYFPDIYHKLRTRRKRTVTTAG